MTYLANTRQNDRQTKILRNTSRPRSGLAPNLIEIGKAVSVSSQREENCDIHSLSKLSSAAVDRQTRLTEHTDKLKAVSTGTDCTIAAQWYMARLHHTIAGTIPHRQLSKQTNKLVSVWQIPVMSRIVTADRAAELLNQSPDTASSAVGPCLCLSAAELFKTGPPPQTRWPSLSANTLLWYIGC